ncbi:hypothetical protein HZS_411, partial [Henneguya salminicola]
MLILIIICMYIWNGLIYFRILYIDEGFYELLGLENIFICPIHFLHIPSAHMNCVLSGILPMTLSTNNFLNCVKKTSNDWDISCISYLEELINDKKMFVKIKKIDHNYVFHVDLLMQQDEILIDIKPILIDQQYAGICKNTSYKMSLFINDAGCFNCQEKSHQTLQKFMSQNMFRKIINNTGTETQIINSCNGASTLNSKKKDEDIMFASKTNKTTINQTLVHGEAVSHTKIVKMRRAFDKNKQGFDENLPNKQQTKSAWAPKKGQKHATIDEPYIKPTSNRPLFRKKIINENNDEISIAVHSKSVARFYNNKQDMSDCEEDQIVKYPGSKKPDDFTHENDNDLKYFSSSHPGNRMETSNCTHFTRPDLKRESQWGVNEKTDKSRGREYIDKNSPTSTTHNKPLCRPGKDRNYDSTEYPQSYLSKEEIQSKNSSSFLQSRESYKTKNESTTITPVWGISTSYHRENSNIRNNSSGNTSLHETNSAQSLKKSHCSSSFYNPGMDRFQRGSLHSEEKQSVLGNFAEGQQWGIKDNKSNPYKDRTCSDRPNIIKEKIKNISQKNKQPNYEINYHKHTTGNDYIDVQQERHVHTKIQPVNIGQTLKCPMNYNFDPKQILKTTLVNDGALLNNKTEDIDMSSLSLNNKLSHRQKILPPFDLSFYENTTQIKNIKTQKESYDIQNERKWAAKSTYCDSTEQGLLSAHHQNVRDEGRKFIKQIDNFDDEELSLGSTKNVSNESQFIKSYKYSKNSNTSFNKPSRLNNNIKDFKNVSMPLGNPLNNRIEKDIKSYDDTCSNNIKLLTRNTPKYSFRCSKSQGDIKKLHVLPKKKIIVDENDEIPPPLIDFSELHEPVYFDPSHVISKKIINFEELNLPESLIYSLKTMGINSPSITLQYSWFSMNSSSCTVISPHKSGLTFSALFSAIYRYFDILSNHRSSSNPIILIICNGWVNVESCINMLQSILYRIKKIKILSLYGAIKNKAKILQLLSGCDIIVSTLPSLIVAHSKKFIILNDIKNIIIDDAYEIIEKYSSKINFIAKLFQNIEFKLILSHYWSENLLKLKSKNDHLIIIDPIEVASFKKINFIVKMCYNSQKDIYLQQYLNNNCSHKTIICVESALDADEITQILSKLNFHPIKITEWQSPSELSDIINIWSKCNRSLFVASENVISRLNITDADCIIHYGVPLSKDSFRRRITCMISSILMDQKVCCTLIVSEEDIKHLLCLINLFQIMAGSKDFIDNDILNRALISRDLEFMSELCPSIKLFGFCQNYYNCKKCHTINWELSSLSHWPSSGFLKLKVINIQSATHFWCRVISHTDIVGDTTTTVKCDDSFALLSTDFQFAMTKSNKLSTVSINHKFIQDKTLIAYKDNDGIFHRIYITSIIEYDIKIPRPSKFTAFCIDLGCSINVTYDNLYEIPSEKYKKIKPLVAEIIFVGLKPKHKEIIWQPECTKLICDSINNAIIEVSVIASSANTMWVNQVLIYDVLPSISQKSILFSLKRVLLDNEYASSNHQHELSLINRNPIVKTCNEQKLDQFQLNSFQTIDLNTTYDIFVLNFDDSGFLYITLYESQHKLQLMDEIIMNNIDQFSTFTPIIGSQQICLSCYISKWYRTLIVGETDTQYSAYLVDIGQIILQPKDSLRTISDELINFMPYQAIKCQLYGHDNRIAIGEQNLTDIHDVLLNTRLQAIPINSSPTNYGSMCYLIKLSKKDDRVGSTCLSLYLFFNCLIVPNSELIEDIFPCNNASPSPNNSWNLLLNKFFIEGDNDVTHKLVSIYDHSNSDTQASLQCDIEFVNKWVERMGGNYIQKVSTFDHIDISPIHETSDLIPVEPLVLKEYFPSQAKWCQSDNDIYLHIFDTDITETFIDISLQDIKIQFTSNDTKYNFQLHLLHQIDPSSSSYEVVNGKIKVILRKVIGDEWISLVELNQKLSWLTYDWDYNTSTSMVDSNIWKKLIDTTQKNSDDLIYPSPLINQ